MEAKLHNTFLDSALSEQMIDSDYVQLRADSDYIKTAADSAYIKTVVYNDTEKLIFGQGEINDHIQSFGTGDFEIKHGSGTCLLYTSPSPRDLSTSRMPSSA